MTHKEVDVVCCTGGTAKVPAIHQALVSSLRDRKDPAAQPLSLRGGGAQREGAGDSAGVVVSQSPLVTTSLASVTNGN